MDSAKWGHNVARKFFARRKPVNLDFGPAAECDFQEYINVPPIIGAVIATQSATLIELQTVLSVEDVYDLLEIRSIDAYNRKLLAKTPKNKKGY